MDRGIYVKVEIGKGTANPQKARKFLTENTILLESEIGKTLRRLGWTENIFVDVE